MKINTHLHHSNIFVPLISDFVLKKLFLQVYVFIHRNIAFKFIFREFSKTRIKEKLL